MEKNESLISRMAHSPKAELVMYIISFTESSFFPLPPDPMLISLCLLNKGKIIRYAFLCAVSSVIGGLLGYFIGYSLFASIGVKLLKMYSYEEKFSFLVSNFQNWAFLIIALKGLTPIPFKLITIASGAAKVNLVTFITASIIARGFRFSLVAIICHFFGDRVRIIMNKYTKSTIVVFLFLTIFGMFLLFFFPSKPHQNQGIEASPIIGNIESQ